MRGSLAHRLLALALAVAMTNGYCEAAFYQTEFHGRYLWKFEAAIIALSGRREQSECNDREVVQVVRKAVDGTAGHSYRVESERRFLDSRGDMADGDGSNSAMGERAKFHAMADGTKEDWHIINEAMAPFIRELPDRVLAHLKMLAGDCGGFAIDRLDHSLQTATRAMHDGRDEEYVVCALLHDMGDILGPRNHADIAAAVVKPFVSEQNHWMVEKHAIFQGYYFFHHIGLDRNMREQFRHHPWFDYTAEFCAKYDQPAFDPQYRHAPLSEFEPLVRNVFSRVKNSIYVPAD